MQYVICGITVLSRMSLVIWVIDIAFSLAHDTDYLVIYVSSLTDLFMENTLQEFYKAKESLQCYPVLIAVK